MYMLGKENRLEVKPAPAKANTLPTGSFCGARSQAGLLSSKIFKKFFDITGKIN